MSIHVSSNNNENYLFGLVLNVLHEVYGYSNEEAESLIHSYYKKISAGHINGTALSPDKNFLFFSHEGHHGLADRIHYHERVKPNANNDEYLNWRWEQNKIKRDLEK